MRITGRRGSVWLFTFFMTAALLTCGYLIGYWTFLGESVTSAISFGRLWSLPLKLLLGLGVVVAVLVFMADRLFLYGSGHSVNPRWLVVLSVGLFAAMYAATYARFEPTELYPFATFLVVPLLIFRFEAKPVAAVLFGAIVLGLYILCAMELGERDAERMATSFYQKELLCPFSESKPGPEFPMTRSVISWKC